MPDRILPTFEFTHSSLNPQTDRCGTTFVFSGLNNEGEPVLARPTNVTHCTGVRGVAPLPRSWKQRTLWPENLTQKVAQSIVRPPGGVQVSHHLSLLLQPILDGRKRNAATVGAHCDNFKNKIFQSCAFRLPPDQNCSRAGCLWAFLLPNPGGPPPTPWRAFLDRNDVHGPPCRGSGPVLVACLRTGATLPRGLFCSV